MSKGKVAQILKEQLEIARLYIKIWWYVPKYCRYCEIMSICRTGKNYSCSRRGCLLLRWKEEDEREREMEERARKKREG